MVTQVIVLSIVSSPYCYWYSDLVTTTLKEENKKLADSLDQEKRERSQGSVLYCTYYLICWHVILLYGNRSYSVIYI